MTSFTFSDRELSRLLYEACPDAVVVIDDAGTILFANPAVNAMFGYEPEELVGQNLSLIQPERLREGHARGLQRYMATGEQTLNWRATQVQALHRDGHEFPVEVAFTGIAPRRFGGFIRDVSARIEAERRIELSEAQYRELLDNANDIVYTHDLQGNFTYVNEAAANAYGYTVEDVLKINIRQIVDPDHIQRAIDATVAKLRDNTPTPPYELLTRTRTGEPVWVEVSTRIVRDADGTPVAVQGMARDVTQRRKTEAALALASDFRDRVMESSPNAIGAIDLEGRITLVNRRFCEMTGYSEDELLGSKFNSLIRPDSLPFVSTSAQRVTAGAAVDDLVFEAQRKDGSVFTARSSLRPLMERGEVAGVIGITEDITERKRSEEALLRASELRDRVMDSTTNAIGVAGLDGRLTLVNRRLCEMTGYSESELLGADVTTLVAPGDLPLIRDQFVAPQRGENVDDLEYRTLRKDGACIDVRVALRPLLDEGRIVGVIGFAEDVTEKKRAEEALTRASELRDRVMDTTTNAIAAFDLEGRMTLVNRRMCEMTGYSEGELVGSTLGPLIRPSVAPRAPGVPPAMARVLAGEPVDDFEFDGERKDGTKLTLRAALRPLYDGDRIVGVIGTAEDITGRKWNDALLRAQQQLLEIIAQGAPLNDVLETITLTVELLLPGAVCSVLLLDAEKGTLQGGSAPSLPAAYTEAIDGIAIGPNVGSCGTAAYRRETVVVSDIATDPLWADFRDLALAHDLRACWSTPIISDSGAVLGAFAIYRREPHTPEQAERELVSVVTHIAGIAIERRLAEEGMQRRAEELSELNERLLVAHGALAESKERLEEKSRLLEVALAAERDRARRDPLTNSLNHAAIADEVQRLIQDPSTHSLALAMIDVDGLKAVNDTWGHQMGDAVLLAVADGLRRGNAIVGRYGGDEFVAILPGADRAAAVAFRAEVEAALAEVELRDKETGSRIQIVASVGLAIYPEEADAVEDLIKLSDSAMYATRRQRADVMASTAFARIHGGDRAAEIVGEIVPFLTSPGELTEKLNLVAARLSAGAGYDGVNFSLYPAAGLNARTASFSEDSAEAAEQYDAESQPQDESGPVRKMLEATRRPIIIDSIADSDFATPAQKEILAKVGLLSAIVAPMIWRGNVLGAISVGSKRPAAFGPRDAQFLSAIATQVTAIVRTAALVDDLQAASSRLQEAHTGTVMMLAAAAEAHDNTTGRHLHRVRTIAELLAREIGHDEIKAKEIGLAAVLHDIGKIRVPDYVLGSTASLSDMEWSLMKDHTIWGGEFLLARGGFELAAQVARSHHERWDGSGYPDGLLGEQIPEPAAITSVADSLDAIISDRPYRSGRPLADAIEEIRAWSGRQFNPHIVDALVRLYDRGELDDLGMHGSLDDALAA